MAIPALSNSFNPKTSSSSTVTIGSTVAIPSMTYPQLLQQAVLRHKKYRVVFDIENRKLGFRVPEIDKKLQAVSDKVEWKNFSGIDFPFLHSSFAIELLGDYNPIYAGRPKKLASAILAAAHPDRLSKYYSLLPCGLIYKVPLLPGSRASRCRSSYAALELMDHWAKKFPRFKAFVDAYVDRKAREQITVECFDLAMEVVPFSFKKIEEENKERQIRHEAREYRKMKKEEEARAKAAYQAATQTGLYPSATGIINASPIAINKPWG